MLVVVDNVALLSWKNRVDLLHLSKLSLSHGTVKWLIIVLFVDINHNVAGFFEWGVDKELKRVNIFRI